MSGFGFFGASLTFSGIFFSRVRVDSNAVCVRASDASTWFLTLYGVAMRDFGLALGESDSSGRFGVFRPCLTCSQAFSNCSQYSTHLHARPARPFGFRAFVARLCAVLHPEDRPGVADAVDAFVGVFELLATLCVREHVSDTFVWSLGLSGPPMRGKSGVTDGFAGPFDFTRFPWTCMRMLSVLGQLRAHCPFGPWPF